MCDICAVARAAHRRGILHRDLKPDNIFVIPPGAERERETIKVLDFGIARFDDLEVHPSLTRCGQLIGAPHYMSPEQWRGDHLDQRTDVYILGVTLYEMIGGVRPFVAHTHASMMAQHLNVEPPPLPKQLGIPPALEAVIRRALAKDPDARQSDASIFARELREAIGHPASNDAVVETSATRWIERLRVVAVLFVIAATVLLMAGLLIFRAERRIRWNVLEAQAGAEASLRPSRVSSPETVSEPALKTGAFSVVMTSRKNLYEIAISPDERWVATIGDEKLIRLRRLDAPHTFTEFVAFEIERGRSIAVSPDSRTIAAGSDDGSIKTWRLDDGRRTTLAGHKGFVFMLGFSLDGQTLLSAGADKVVRRWQVSDGQLIDAFKLPGQGELLVSISPDGQTLALLNRRREIHLWSPAGQRLNVSLAGQKYRITCGAFSRGGEALILGSKGGEVSIWNTLDGRLRQTLKGAGDASSVSFNVDGRLAATGWSDGTIRLWRVRDGSLVKVLEGHQGRVTNLAFGASGRVLVSGGDDQTIRLWRIEEE
jgi:hypothetical protein